MTDAPAKRKATPWGKHFEKALLTGYKHAYPNAFIHRFIDNWQPGRRGHESPPDMLVVRKAEVTMIEAKHTLGKTIGFDRLAPHQRHQLNLIQQHGHNGYIACCFRYPVEGKKKLSARAFLVPITLWMEAEASSGRKSINIQMIEAELPTHKYEMDYQLIAGIPAWIPRSIA